MPSEAPRRKPYATPALAILGALLDVLPAADRRRAVGGPDLTADDVS